MAYPLQLMKFDVVKSKLRYRDTLNKAHDYTNAVLSLRSNTKTLSDEDAKILHTAAEVLLRRANSEDLRDYTLAEMLFENE